MQTKEQLINKLYAENEDFRNYVEAYRRREDNTIEYALSAAIVWEYAKYLLSTH